MKGRIWNGNSTSVADAPPVEDAPRHNRGRTLRRGRTLCRAIFLPNRRCRNLITVGVDRAIKLQLPGSSDSSQRKRLLRQRPVCPRRLMPPASLTLYRQQITNEMQVDAKLETGGSRGQRCHSPGRAGSRGSESRMNPLEPLPLFSAPTTDHGPATGRGGKTRLTQAHALAQPKPARDCGTKAVRMDVRCAGGWLGYGTAPPPYIYIYIYM
jgi:hypothetical protein